MQKTPRPNTKRGKGSFFPKSKKKIRSLKSFAYAPFYCEENIWQLCQHPEIAGKPGSVVFISNPERKCPIWHAKGAGDSHEPVIWDYHVVLLLQSPYWQIWDFDTRLGFPVSTECYFNYSFRRQLPDSLQPQFKLIEIHRFIREFSSDRSHMRGQNNEWLAPPPDWAVIGQDRPSNLLAFANVSNDFGGQVFSLTGFGKYLDISPK